MWLLALAALLALTALRRTLKPLALVTHKLAVAVQAACTRLLTVVRADPVVVAAEEAVLTTVLAALVALLPLEIFFGLPIPKKDQFHITPLEPPQDFLPPLEPEEWAALRLITVSKRLSPKTAP
jgi:hypothetical protein